MADDANDANNKPKDHKVIDFFSGKPLEDIAEERFIRISPENDGLCMLYSNDNNPDKYYAMKILFWALKWNGDVVGVVPWLNKVMACPDIQDPLNGCWEGYYDPAVDSIFYDAPMHKLVELETSVAYFENHLEEGKDIVTQELPDNIGTHALMIGEDKKSVTLTEVVSWQLNTSGEIRAMLVDPDKADYFPILPGDPCLYPAKEDPNFKYFFQYSIANQIKNEDPDALAAISVLLEKNE